MFVHGKDWTYGFVLLVKVVDVAVQDLDKELDRNSGIHARVRDTESALEALEDSLAIAVQLYHRLAKCVPGLSSHKKIHTSLPSAPSSSAFSDSHHK